MFQKKGYVDHSLLKIKDRLSEVSNTKNILKNENDSISPRPTVPTEEHSQIQTINTPPTPKISSGTKTTQSPTVRDETIAALSKRKEEFRLLKRDICEKFAEKLSSFPEDIRITERRIEELRSATEKFAALIDELKSIDEHNWDENTPHSEIGRACRKAENARLEFIRVSAKLAALQRESTAAEDNMPSFSRGSIIHELSSISFKQGVKIGFLIFLPMIIAILLSALLLALAYIIALKL